MTIYQHNATIAAEDLSSCQLRLKLQARDIAMEPVGSKRIELVVLGVGRATVTGVTAQVMEDRSDITRKFIVIEDDTRYMFLVGDNGSARRDHDTLRDDFYAATKTRVQREQARGGGFIRFNKMNDSRCEIVIGGTSFAFGAWKLLSGDDTREVALEAIKRIVQEQLDEVDVAISWDPRLYPEF